MNTQLLIEVKDTVMELKDILLPENPIPNLQNQHMVANDLSMRIIEQMVENHHTVPPGSQDEADKMHSIWSALSGASDFLFVAESVTDDFTWGVLRKGIQKNLTIAWVLLENLLRGEKG